MPVIPPAKKTTGAYRKEIYALFEGFLGRSLTSDEHARMKQILKGYLDEHRIIVDSSKPLEHIFTCSGCRSMKRTVGHEATKRLKRFIIDEVDTAKK